MDIKTADRLTGKYPLGPLVAEGKTKKIYEVSNKPQLVVLVSKDDITAGDGAKHDIIANKGQLANETTCNVFRLLKACGIPVAFIEQDSVTSFVGERCRMLPYEVVVRREAHGSYLKRHPHVQKGQVFSKLLVEFFLKTKDKRWQRHTLACDDPLMSGDRNLGKIHLFDAGKPIHGSTPFLTLPEMEVFTSKDEWSIFPEMERIASLTFLVLEKAWQLEGRALVDFKVEFGLDSKGQLLLADVIDNDSWRVIENGFYIDKQMYRDGGALSKVAATYELVAGITKRFELPHQRIILWRGSDKDNFDVFYKALGEFKDLVSAVTCSVHKEPVKASLILEQMVHEVPDCMVIAYVGKSNGAGPTLSALSTAPVITVPASLDEFRDDVWSSVRLPSNVPAMTVLEPANAVLAALNILSARNPRIYAHVRGEVEKRLVNTFQV